MITDLYLGMAFLGLPLIVHNGYFDITGTKTIFFVLLSGLYLLAIVAMWLLNEKRRKPAALCPAETASFALVFIALLASIGSGFFTESFIGPSSRFQGAGMLLLYALVFLAVRRNVRSTKWALRGLFAGVILSGALAVSNRLGWDVFGFSGQLTDFDRGRFISTVGNINFLAAYCSLTVPVCAAIAVAKRNGFAAVAAVSGVAAAVCSRSSSAALGLLSAVVLAPLFFAEKKTVRKRYGFALLALAVLAAAGLLLLNTVWRSVPLGRAENLLRFSPEWGTDRGKVWVHCGKMFASLLWGQKLFGGGGGIVARLDRVNRLFPDAVLNAAHNEYLQILLQWGILGLGSCFAWIFLSFTTHFNRQNTRMERSVPRAFSLGAAAYLIQAVVNIAQAPAAPMLILMLALTSAECYN